MLVANPIYDVVFKYMMEDTRVAKIFLSTIIAKEILEIQFLPQELSGIKSTKDEPLSLNLTVYRLDFSAKVRDKYGKEEVIIIEVQKTKLYGDVMRFRRYLGKQYMDESLTYETKDAKGKLVKMGVPIYSIYFLGSSLVGFEDHPIVRIKMNVTNQVTGESIEQDDDFIKSMYHEGTIVNIPALKSQQSGDLEILLTIFAQQNITENMHISNLEEKNYPIKFHPIIKRLKQAVQVKEVREIMEIEDEFAKEINEYENRVLKQTELYKEELRQKEEERKQKEDAQYKQDRAIILLLENGVSPQIISEQLNLSMTYIQSLLN
jgi:hypothetical protein